MKVCVIIPARGGSKGIPNKNIKLLGGKPLIHYTLDAARNNFNMDQIVVSTDSQNIRTVVESYGQPIFSLRPSELSQDNSSSEDVINYELNQWKLRNGSYPDHVILLQVTSPLRNAAHLNEAWNEYCNLGEEMLVSVCASKCNPYYNLFEENDGYLRKSKEGDFTRRQDCPEIWELNGAIYIFQTHRFLEVGIEGMKKKKYEMDNLSSIDIDNMNDWMLAEILLNQRN